MRYTRKTMIVVCSEATTMVIPDKVWDLAGEYIMDALDHAMEELNENTNKLEE